MKTKSIKVFKNSEKFFIFRSKENNKYKVFKIAHKNPNKLMQEVKLLKKLINSSKILNKKIPKIFKHGLIKKGMHAKKGYYVIDYVKGFTFTEIIKKNLCTYGLLNKIHNYTFQNFLQILREKKEKKKNTLNTSLNIKKLIFIELEKIKKKDILRRIYDQKKIKVDDLEYYNLTYYLNIILNSKAFKKIYKNNFYLSNIGHWNFHGGNIIYPNINKNIKTFYLIDPDATWKINDPFFSIARYVYTYPHDTIENKKYYIVSKFFNNLKSAKHTFKTKIIWSSIIKKKYENNFSEFFTFKDKKKLNLLNENEKFRLKICILLCLLRGINSNFEKRIQIIDDKGVKFKNDSIYIFLTLLKFLKTFTNEIKKK